MFLASVLIDVPALPIRSLLPVCRFIDMLALLCIGYLRLVPLDAKPNWSGMAWAGFALNAAVLVVGSGAVVVHRERELQ